MTGSFRVIRGAPIPLTMAEIATTEIDPFLTELWERKGTDLLFTVGIPPLLRIDGVMLPATGAAVLTNEDTERIVLGPM